MKKENFLLSQDFPNNSSKHYLQLHPVLMLIGFIIIGSEGSYLRYFKIQSLLLNNSCQLSFVFCYFDTAIMVYKVLPWSHDVNKAIHLVLHGIAIALGIFGIYCAFKNHNESGIANLYSLHSWLGISTISLYVIQVK